MAKRLPQSYNHTNPPVNFEDWHRWIDNELQQIQLALLAAPILCSVDGTGTIGVDTTPTSLILGIGDDATYDSPEGSWDPTTGEYSASLTGIYNINCLCTIQPFGTGNKNYAATLIVLVNGINRAEVVTGGVDDVPLAQTLLAGLLIYSGDIIAVELSVVHEQFTGTADYVFTESFHRVAQV